MESLTQSVAAAVQAADYAHISAVFTTQWHALGQGEQRALASHFIRTAVAAPGFFPAAFRAAPLRAVVDTALRHLPPTVEGAADNALRQQLFEFTLNEEGDPSAAGKILAGLRMEENEDSTYYLPPIERVDVFVKVAECYLEEDLTVEAEGAVTKAGTVIEATGLRISGEDGAPQDERAVTLVLRYKSTYARVLDANRKFLQAAMKYHDLSTAYLHTDAIDGDDLLIMLGRAVTCAILSPNSAQRQRVLGALYKDARLAQLDALPAFQSHAAVLTKMYLNRIVQKRELEQFEASLAAHQKAVMADGLTIVERGVLEHNMVAVGHLYTSIYFTQLGELLGVVDAAKAERVAATMIGAGSLGGSIDEVEGLLRFHATVAQEDAPLRQWDETITSFCMQLNRVTDVVRAHEAECES